MTVPPAPRVWVKLRLAADPQAIRDGLCQLMAATPLCDLSDDVRGSIQIVLAEVLNNIVEHAYAGSAGYIDVKIDYEHPTLSFEVTDTGHAMPSDRLPGGELAMIDARTDLPEGGFGWSMIRSLTQGLIYTRRSGRNTLEFWIEAG